MKSVIVYRSFLGTTRKYARWLSEELTADAVPFGRATNKVLSRYDTVIVASGTYAGWMPLTGFLKKTWPILRKKKVVIVSVGISPPGEVYTKETLEKIPKSIRSRVTVLRLPGAIFGRTPPETGVVRRENIRIVLKALQ
jgi:menaquinone-dependent protoporphyrinogen IX oxidase